MGTVENIDTPGGKRDKRLTTIDGVDYWTYHWSTRGSEQSQQLVATVGEHAVKEEAARVETRIEYIHLASFIIQTLVTIAGMILGYVWFRGIVGAILMLVISWMIIHVIALSIKVPLLISTDKTPLAYDFKNNVNSKPIFKLTQVSEEQAHDVASELNSLREQGKDNEYMQIIEKIVKQNNVLLTAQEEENRIHKIKEEREQLAKAVKQRRETSERSKTNHYLNHRTIQEINDLHIIAEIETLEKKLAPNLNGKTKLAPLKERFHSIEKMVNQGVTIDMNAYNDCRSELYNVTAKYNETLENELGLSTGELDEYQKLVNNCTKILDRIIENSVEYRSFDARIANIFLEDKYSL